MTGRGHHGVLVVLMLASALLASLARAEEDPCAGGRPSLARGPAGVGLLDGHVGTPTGACPRSEVRLGGDLYLVAELAEFYGDVRLNVPLFGSYAITDRTAVFMSLEAFRFQMLLSSINATALGTGYLSAGATQVLWRGRGVVLSYSGRLVLPTASALDQGSKPLALDSSLVVAWAPHRWVTVHGALTLAGSVGLSAGPALPRGGVWLVGGLDFHPLRWLGIVAELDAGFGYRGAVDVVAVAGGFRFAMGDHLGLEIVASYPFAGAERALIAAELRLSYRFGDGGDGAEPAVEPVEERVAEPAEGAVNEPVEEPAADEPTAEEVAPAPVE